MTTMDVRGQVDLSVARHRRDRPDRLESDRRSPLYEHALARGDGRLAEGGPLVVDTGKHTGRSPKDKFIVREPGSEGRIWWGEVNKPLAEERFERLRDKVVDVPRNAEDALRRRRVRRRRSRPSHRRAGRHRRSPYHALFAKTMFIEPSDEELDRLRAAGARPARARRSRPTRPTTARAPGTFVVLHPTRTEVLIGGTFYAGEIKKSIFTVMNDRLPLEGVFPMHCSANVGDGRRRGGLLRALGHRQDDALGRSRARALIGDDEHGWSDRRRLQHRGRLLREGDPPLAGGRARDLRDDAHRSGRCSRTSSSTSAACSTSTTTRRPRTRAPRTSSSRSRTRSRRSARAIRARSSCSPPTRSASCRRSRG